MNVHVLLVYLWKLEEREHGYPLGPQFLRCVNSEVFKHCARTWQKKKVAGSIDAFDVAFKLTDVELSSRSSLSWSWWRAFVLMNTLSSQHLLRLHEVVLRGSASGCLTISTVQSATKSEELSSRVLTDLCSRRSRRARRKSDTSWRLCNDQVWRTVFRRKVYVIRRWDELHTGSP